MIPAVGFGLLVTSWLGIAAQATTSRPERVILFGSEYARVEEWATVNRLKAEWTTRNRELRLSAPGISIVFGADARAVIFNGISVYLSAPIAVRNGAAYVPPVDLTTTVQPLLADARRGAPSPLNGERAGVRGETVPLAPNSSKSRPIINVCIDPGHGGKDPGHLAGKEQEKKYTLLLAREVGEQLGKAGFKVSYTRTGDSFVDLPARSEVARKRNADLFVSLHFNSAEGQGGEAIKGVEVYCLTAPHTSSTNARGEGSAMGACPGNKFDSKNVVLAYQMQKALVTKLGLEDRGVRRARFAVLRNAEMPAVLIESGFLSNPAESKRIYDPKFRKQLAAAIVEGVQSYKRDVASQ